jgi:hypothetical protein
VTLPPEQLLAREWGTAEAEGARPEGEARTPALRAAPAEEFAAVVEASAEPLLGDSRTTVLAAGGMLVAYGDGGAGKTTLALDAALHLATGRAWLGLPVPRPARVLWVENEGPRGMFRQKVRDKLAAWDGPAVDGRLVVLEEPWALFTFAADQHRAEFVDLVREHDAELVVAGPVQRLGVEGGGTPAEVAAFVNLLEHVRAELDRPLAYWLVHHENKAGDVSGAWEGVSDTTAHVQARGNGHTALRWQKVRWGSDLHGKTWALNWRPGEAFELDETPETTDDDLAEQLVQAVRESPGASWNALDEQLSAKATRKRAIRDRLLETGALVNAGTGARMRLYLPDDPDLGLLRPDRDAPGTHSASPPGVERKSATASRVPPYRDADAGRTRSTPAPNPSEDS